MKEAPRKGGAEAQARNSQSTYSNSLDSPQASLAEPLRRLAWLRQELDLWNEAGGDRPMPQPSDYQLRLPRLRPSEVAWRTAA